MSDVISKRKKEYLDFCADFCLEEGNRAGRLLKEYALMEKGDKPDSSHIKAVFFAVYYHLDCSDFILAMLIRMLYRDRTLNLLDEEVKEEAKRLILTHAYWLTQDCAFFGKQNMWTENHIMMYHTDAYLAGQLFADETFTVSGKTGRQLMEETGPKILDWIRIRALVGFSEWDSNTYIGVNLTSLINLYDFCNDSVIAAQAEKLLNIMMVGIGINSFEGVHGCSHGRTYTRVLKNSTLEAVAGINWIIWGKPREFSVNQGPLVLAVSKYVPPELIISIGYEAPEELIDQEQQSFDVEDGPSLGKGFDSEEDITLYWQNMGYTHRNIVKRNMEIGEKYGIIVHDKVYDEYMYNKDCIENGILPEKCRCITYISRVNKMTYKTPDYMLSCAQDFRKGQKGFQQHIWQATLGKGAIIFTTHPGTFGEGDGRPDFWAGNATFPRAAQYKNTVFCIYNIENDMKINYSHAYLPVDCFDEVCREGNWVFVKKDEAYGALYSQNGFYEDSFQTELSCRVGKNIWICELGRRKLHGSFKEFVEKRLNTVMETSDLRISYENLAGETISFGWDGDLEVDGRSVELSGYKRFDNRYVCSEYMKGEYILKCGDQQMKIDLCIE